MGYIIIIALCAWALFRWLKKKRIKAEEAREWEREKAEKARMRAEGMANEAEMYGRWKVRIEFWSKKIDDAEPKSELIYPILSAEGMPLHFNAKYQSYNEEELTDSILNKMDTWLDNALKDFWDSLEERLKGCSTAQDVSDVYSEYHSTLQQLGQTEYYREHRLASFSSLTADFVQEVTDAIKDKLVPITVNDVLVFNKICYLCGEGSSCNDDGIEEHSKWFVCENEVLIYRGGKSQSLPIMRIVNLEYDGGNCLNLEVLVRTNSFTTTIAGDNVFVAEKVVRAIQSKHMNQPNK